MHKQWMGLQDGQAEGLPLWSSGSDAYLPNARVPGSIPGQRTRTHRPQLRGHMPQQMWTILRATTKNCCSQINGKMDFYKKWRASGEKRQRLPWNQRLRRRLCHFPWWPLDQRWARQRPGCVTGGVNGLREYRQWVGPPCSPVTQPTLPIITEVLWIRDHYPRFID